MSGTGKTVFAATHMLTVATWIEEAEDMAKEGKPLKLNWDRSPPERAAAIVVARGWWTE